MDTSSTDSAIITSSLSDKALFGELFRRHHSAVHGYVQRRLGKDLADDLAADAFVIAFRSRARYESRNSSARPWLFGIANNLVRRHHRTERRMLVALAKTRTHPVASEFERVDDRLNASAQQGLLAQGLASMSKNERDVLLLHAWAELSYAEIAETLELPIGTVRSRLSRARARMREPFLVNGHVGVERPST